MRTAVRPTQDWCLEEPTISSRMSVVLCVYVSIGELYHSSFIPEQCSYPVLGGLGLAGIQDG